MAGCFVTFVASHAAVIAPLVYKRVQMQQQCQDSKKNIFASLMTLQSTAPDDEQLLQLIQNIKTVVHATMSAHVSHRASQTWGMRARKLDEISEKLTEDLIRFNQEGKTHCLLQEIIKYWSQQSPTPSRTPGSAP